MRKIKLDLDLLAVDSFETVTEEAGEGTVLGHEITQNQLVCSNSNASECAGSCDTGSCSSVLGTCAYTCATNGGQTVWCV